MSIWFAPYTTVNITEEMRRRGANTMAEHLGIEITELGDDYIVGTMPVDHRTRQSHGVLHGGASVALCETLASIAANLVIDPAQSHCVGLEINANHIGSCHDGIVTGKSVSVHLGRTTQVWETKIHQGSRLICASRITLAVLKRS